VNCTVKVGKLAERAVIADLLASFVLECARGTKRALMHANFWLSKASLTIEALCVTSKAIFPCVTVGAFAIIGAVAVMISEPKLATGTSIACKALSLARLMLEFARGARYTANLPFLWLVKTGSALVAGACSINRLKMSNCTLRAHSLFGVVVLARCAIIASYTSATERIGLTILAAWTNVELRTRRAKRLSFLAPPVVVILWTVNSRLNPLN
jgi:hypothetical protein